MACMSIVNAVGDPTTVDHSDRALSILHTKGDDGLHVYSEGDPTTVDHSDRALSILHTKGDDGLHVYSECCRGPDNSGPL